MSKDPKMRFVVEPLKCRSAEVGRWLWAIEDTRRRTLKALEGLGD